MRKSKRLSLNRETILSLTPKALAGVDGAGSPTRFNSSWSVMEAGDYDTCTGRVYTDTLCYPEQCNPTQLPEPKTGEALTV